MVQRWAGGVCRRCREPVPGAVNRLCRLTYSSNAMSQWRCKSDSSNYSGLGYLLAPLFAFYFDQSELEQQICSDDQGNSTNLN